jgi:hypothetical protein
MLDLAIIRALGGLLVLRWWAGALVVRFTTIYLKI